MTHIKDRSSKNVRMLFTGYLTGRSHSHICVELAQHMNSRDLNVELSAPQGNLEKQGSLNLRWQYSPLVNKLIYRFGGDSKQRELSERAHARRVKKYDVCYPWAGFTVNYLERVRQRGAMIVLELFNSHINYAADILAPVYERESQPLPSIYKHGIEEENRRLELADAVFSPSAFVTKSLLENGVSADKIMEASYGYSPSRVLAEAESKSGGKNTVNFLFVGSVGVRKGVPYLLDYWAEAKPENAKLTFVGEISSDLPEKYRQKLHDDDSVEWVNYTTDIKKYFSEADVFIFPSHEEGGPLVTYEAMANGLPVLVSKAGAGRAVRDGIDGLVIDIDDKEQWIDAIRRLSSDSELRESMAASAHEEAKHYTWTDVAAKRAKLLQEAYGKWKENISV
ncbi:glycosyltransferase family 4 protein [Aeoliella mucimassa]|uniref:D-inositol 3-phosphate glycosyltransferase n=1 Tax=Aeoliella mucimassa TaxID=2527972 RepID=A0A518AQA7_9BACT|nr:glycosyltransferase family 4 protein [Aeoliella mucimassa]QDU56905.1 D-inositol 3-phosphate glycosyltransferase [Aeoliella mucimassa]